MHSTKDQTTEPCRNLTERFSNILSNISKRPLIPDKTLQKTSGALTRCRQCRRAAGEIGYLEASLFFSLRDLARATAGRSLTGPMPSMAALSFWSCSPMLWSFWGFGVRSLASVLRALRRPFLPEQNRTKEWNQHRPALFGSAFPSINPPVSQRFKIIKPKPGSVAKTQQQTKTHLDFSGLISLNGNETLLCVKCCLVWGQCLILDHLYWI